MASPTPRLSVAIPLYNEEAVLPELLHRLGTVLDALPGGPHEVVFVDDGSRDRTPEILRQAAEEDQRIAVVQLSRNFGHQAAITAALDRADGDYVMVMDGDLQDPPEAIPRFLAKAREGFDVIYARRVGRKEGIFLRACYYLAYRVIAVLADVRIPLDSGDFALFSRRVVRALRSTPERHRYLRGLRAWVGFRQAPLPVERQERGGGRSKYTLWGLIRLALDGIFAFSVVPLRAAAALGVAAMTASGAYAAYAVCVKLMRNVSPQGFTALIVATVFLAGVQLLFLGVIGEYVGRIYEEVKARPHYVVQSVSGENRDAGSTASA